MLILYIYIKEEEFTYLNVSNEILGIFFFMDNLILKLANSSGRLHFIAERGKCSRTS